MTQYEYFSKWFDSRALSSEYISFLNTEHFLVIKTQIYIDLGIYEWSYIISVSSDEMAGVLINDSGIEIPATFSKIDEVRAWYDSIMEKWYLNNFLNDTLPYTKDELKYNKKTKI